MSDSNSGDKGKIVLNGLLEGKLPETGDDYLKLLNEWVVFAKKSSLLFSLEVDGNSFSLLADNTPVPASGFAGAPNERIAEMLNQLVKIFPKSSRHHFFSTIRSIEYRPHVNIETIYFFNPDGNIDFKVREIEVIKSETEPAPAKHERLMMGLVAFLLVAIAFLVSTFFIDYPAIWNDLASSVTKAKTEDIKLSYYEIEPYLTVKPVSIENHGSVLKLEFARGKDFPLTLEKYNEEKSKASAKNDLSRCMMVEAIAKGYLRLEYFNEKFEIVSTYDCRIKDLFIREKILVEIPLPRPVLPAQIRLTY